MLRIKRILPAALAACLSLAAINSLRGEIAGNDPSHAGAAGMVFAQDNKAPVVQSAKETTAAESPEAIYIVMSVVLIIWIGLALFIFNLDRKVTRIEKYLNK